MLIIFSPCYYLSHLPIICYQMAVNNYYLFLCILEFFQIFKESQSGKLLETCRYNIFNNNIFMNRNSKLLPQLNQLFLQKQSYTSHKKKILQIRKKKPQIAIREQLQSTHSRRSSKEVSLKQSKATILSRTPKALISQIPPTILERCSSLGNSLQWMSPFRRKQFLDQMKQNQRIKSRISSSKSDLRKTKLSREYEKFAKIKQRLLKYSVNPQSHKAILKSQKTLKYTCQSPRSPKNMIISQPKITPFGQNRRSSFASYMTQQQRKESNFSVFVKKTYEIKKQAVDNAKLRLQSKMRPLINYSKMQKSIDRYSRKHERRLKTEISRISEKHSRMATNINYRYFVNTENSTQ